MTTVCMSASFVPDRGESAPTMPRPIENEGRQTDARLIPSNPQCWAVVTCSRRYALNVKTSPITPTRIAGKLSSACFIDLLNFGKEHAEQADEDGTPARKRYQDGPASVQRLCARTIANPATNNKTPLRAIRGVMLAAQIR